MNHALTPSRRRLKEARPQQLLEAALTLFAEKGFAATRAEEVALRAGVSKGTLYLYYPSKEELLKAVIREHLSSRIAAGAAAVEKHRGPVAELLREVFARWWIEVFDSPTSGVFKLIVSEVRNFPDIAEFYVTEVIQPAENLIARMLQRGIDSGEFVPLDIPSVVHSLCLPMVMLCVYKHSLGACLGGQHEDFEPHAFVRAHVDLIVRGLVRHESAPVRHKAAARRNAA
jgi:AcrR family transcriptional regulator